MQDWFLIISPILFYTHIVYLHFKAFQGYDRQNGYNLSNRLMIAVRSDLKRKSGGEAPPLKLKINAIVNSLWKLNYTSR